MISLVAPTVSTVYASLSFRQFIKTALNILTLCTCTPGRKKSSFIIPVEYICQLYIKFHTDLVMTT